MNRVLPLAFPISIAVLRPPLAVLLLVCGGLAGPVRALDDADLQRVSDGTAWTKRFWRPIAIGGNGAPRTSAPRRLWPSSSSQNRWEGVIVGGHKTARICAQPITRESFYNGNWSVQNPGAMIVSHRWLPRLRRRPYRS